MQQLFILRKNLKKFSLCFFISHLTPIYLSFWAFLVCPLFRMYPSFPFLKYYSSVGSGLCHCFYHASVLSHPLFQNFPPTTCLLDCSCSLHLSPELHASQSDSKCLGERLMLTPLMLTPVFFPLISCPFTHKLPFFQHCFSVNNTTIHLV